MVLIMMLPRPVGSFFDRSKLSLPALTQVVSRLKANVAYFQSNYLLVFLVLCLYSALTSPLFLIALIAVGVMWLYMWRWRSDPYVVRGYTIPEKVTLVGLLAVTAFMFYLSSATDVVFWLLIVTVCCAPLPSLPPSLPLLPPSRSLMASASRLLARVAVYPSSCG